MRNLVFAFALALLSAQAFVPPNAFAQDDANDPAKTARLRIGPLAVNPTIAVSNAGVDTNVFNTWDDPKKDFTATVIPGADFWFRAGRTRLIGRANVGYMYFQQYANERSLNTDLSGRFEVNLLHLMPYVFGSYLSTRDRPGFEIDARARRHEDRYGLGVDVPLTKRTTFGLQAQRLDTRYAADAVFLGTYLREAFDRREDNLQASFRYKLTTLTTLVLQGNAERIRFNYSPQRNSDGVRIMPGVEFNAFAIVQGSAFVGFRKLDMLGVGVPDYKGAVASVDLGYTLLGTTRFAVQASRDVQYSFETSWPYYVLTGYTGTITQRLAGPFDAQARYGRQNLDYTWAGQVALTTPRTDTVRFYGGGIGYRFGRSARLGFNVDSYHRTSAINTRTYNGLRIGTSLTYGF